jgi:hypothetical protein
VVSGIDRTWSKLQFVLFGFFRNLVCELAHSFIEAFGLRHCGPPLDMAVWHRRGAQSNTMSREMAEESGNLFGFGPSQLGFDLGDAPKPKDYEPDREEVRQELHEILAQARAAVDDCPWDERTFKYHKVVFPQMANWLPPEERDQLRFDFMQEVERIERLLAA